MRLVLIDNYDSFTYNVADLLRAAGAEVEVLRNDAVTVAQVLTASYDGIVISPGPGGPVDAGVSMALIEAATTHDVPLLGICLGMQCIAQVFGASVVRLDGVVHGSATPVRHDRLGVLATMPPNFAAGRYHSLVVHEPTLGEVLMATAHTTDDVLMGIRHTQHPIEGVQFHPESILTPEGLGIAEAFIASIERVA